MTLHRQVIGRPKVRRAHCAPRRLVSMAVGACVGAIAGGFPADEPGSVFKFRHRGRRQAAEMDVRPGIPGDYRIECKAGALPSNNQVGNDGMLLGATQTGIVGRLKRSAPRARE